MLTISRPLTPKFLILVVAGICCQSVWAQPAQITDALARYVPVQDELCNYCRDFSSSTSPTGALLTLYVPGMGYPYLLTEGVESAAEQRLDPGMILIPTEMVSTLAKASIE